MIRDPLELTLLWTLLILAGFGLLLSIYMTRIFRRVQRVQQVQCMDDSCPIVMKTAYARALGFPNFYVAIPYYAGLLALAGLRMAGVARWLLVPALVASGLALAMSGWLTLALVVKLKQRCPL